MGSVKKSRQTPGAKASPTAGSVKKSRTHSAGAGGSTAGSTKKSWASRP